MLSPHINKYIIALRALCIFAALIALAQKIKLLDPDFAVVLLVDNSAWKQAMGDFVLTDRFVIISLAIVSTAAWLYVVFQVWRLCNLYSQGMIFTLRNSGCFRHMSYGLMFLSLAQTIDLPLIGAFLYWRDVIPQMIDINITNAININFLMARALFWLIAKIMEHATAMQNEAEFTI